MTTTIPDISLITMIPTQRRGGDGHNRVDLRITAPPGANICVANYVRRDIADAIITAINERDQLLDLLANLVDDAPNALADARFYLATHPTP